MTCKHPHSRWFRRGNSVYRRCLACLTDLDRDSVVLLPPASPTLANQVDPEELADCYSEYQFRH